VIVVFHLVLERHTTQLQRGRIKRLRLTVKTFGAFHPSVERRR
jgi:hypothetical protein